jgi:hypothetical protein
MPAYRATDGRSPRALGGWRVPVLNFAASHREPVFDLTRGFFDYDRANDFAARTSAPAREHIISARPAFTTILSTNSDRGLFGDTYRYSFRSGFWTLRPTNCQAREFAAQMANTILSEPRENRKPTSTARTHLPCHRDGLRRVTGFARQHCSAVVRRFTDHGTIHAVAVIGNALVDEAANPVQTAHWAVLG